MNQEEIPKPNEPEQPPPPKPLLANLSKSNQMPLILLISFLVVSAGVFVWQFSGNQPENSNTQIDEPVEISSFEECVEAGYPVLEIYPEQCNTPSGENFIKQYPEENDESDESDNNQPEEEEEPEPIVNQDPKPEPEPEEEPAARAVNCSPADASVYDLANADKTTLEYLRTGTYLSTSEFYDAIVFAGLESTVNANGTVVFAPSDFVFDSLTQAQRDYLYSSPNNMKSFLKWHIVSSCVVWADDIEFLTGSRKISTLGGSATYVAGSPGTLAGQTVGIWDFYTKNGAVHYIGGFIPFIPTD